MVQSDLDVMSSSQKAVGREPDGNKWTGVVLPDGKRGYMMTEYLQFD